MAMTPESFCYWLQGFFEISGSKELTRHQIQIIKDHLALVFKKVTPNRTEIPEPRNICEEVSTKYCSPIPLMDCESTVITGYEPSESNFIEQLVEIGKFEEASKDSNIIVGLGSRLC